MFFFGSGILGLILLIPMLFVMFSNNGWRYMIPMMWVILGVDLLFGSFLFAAIQGALLWYAYHHRRQLSQGPGPAARGPGQPTGGSGPSRQRGSGQSAAAAGV